MPDTQSYSVDWNVTIDPEGDVSQDVSEITIIRQKGVNSATVKLDTSQRPHALEEQQDISITIEDGNEIVTFDGYTDAVKDEPDTPIVTVDARSPAGLLDDATAVASIQTSDVFAVIEEIIDSSAGRVREITFDAAAARQKYGNLQNTTHFGKVDLTHSGSFGVNTDSFTQYQTASEETEAEIRFDTYFNTTGTTYTLDITGNDGDGNTVTASLDLPPGDTASDAFGAQKVKLALSGGNELWDEVTSISTDIPDLSSFGQELKLTGQLFNYRKTDWELRLAALNSVRDAIAAVVSYISGQDAANDWEFFVDESTSELIVRPEGTQQSDVHVFREGDNVLKPVAQRDLDGVRNMIKVIGSGNVNVWVWAYDGDFHLAKLNPFGFGTYPDQGNLYKTSPGSGSNDIDQINLRGEVLRSDTWDSLNQAIDVAKKALDEFYRTPVSGKAPVEGVLDVSPGDKAEIYYPSRGIPQKVQDNVYPIEQVEYKITPNEAKTTVDWGTKQPNLADVISSGGNIIRSDISTNISQYSQSITTTNKNVTNTSDTTTESTSDVETTGGGGGGGTSVVVGTLSSQNDDGTWVVDGEDGETYDNVRVI